MVNEKEVIALAAVALVVGAVWKARYSTEVEQVHSAADDIIQLKSKELWKAAQTGDFTHFSYFRDRNYATQPFAHQ